MTFSPDPTSVLDLDDAEYVLLTTYTQDGRAKPTPVWAAVDGDALVVYTDHDAWKVRRIANDPRVTVAVCDARGHPRSSPLDGLAVVVEDDALVARVTAAIRRKYGWKMRLAERAEQARALLSRGATGRRVGVVVRDARP